MKTRFTYVAQVELYFDIDVEVNEFSGNQHEGHAEARDILMQAIGANDTWDNDRVDAEQELSPEKLARALRLAYRIGMLGLEYETKLRLHDVDSISETEWPQGNDENTFIGQLLGRS